MDVTLSYTVDSIPVQTVYPNSKTIPDYSTSIITLMLSSTTNYDTLNDNMSNSPTDIEIEFTSMGETRTYNGLILSNCKYVKTLSIVDENTTTIYQMQITFNSSS